MNYYKANNYQPTPPAPSLISPWIVFDRSNYTTCKSKEDWTKSIGWQLFEHRLHFQHYQRVFQRIQFMVKFLVLLLTNDLVSYYIWVVVDTVHDSFYNHLTKLAKGALIVTSLEHQAITVSLMLHSFVINGTDAGCRISWQQSLLVMCCYILETVETK